MLQSTAQLFERDLKKFQELIQSFSNEDHLWTTPGTIKNSSGHLALHLCGNLRHFIGHILGNSEYQRNRKNEFSSPPVSAQILIKEINDATHEVSNALSTLTKEPLLKPYPIEVFGSEMTTEFFLIHLYGHLNYHLGQIDYLKRSQE